MYDTTTKKIIKIKEQKRTEELSLITYLTVFAPTAYNNSRYVQEVCKWTAIKSSVVAKDLYDFVYLQSKYFQD